MATGVIAVHAQSLSPVSWLKSTNKNCKEILCGAAHQKGTLLRQSQFWVLYLMYENFFSSALKWHLIYQSSSRHSDFTIKKGSKILIVFFNIFWMFSSKTTHSHKVPPFDVLHHSCWQGCITSFFFRYSLMMIPWLQEVIYTAAFPSLVILSHPSFSFSIFKESILNVNILLNDCLHIYFSESV